MRSKIFFFKKHKSQKNDVKIADKEISDIQEDGFLELYNFCKPYTMTSIERMYALYNSVLYIINNNIEGDFVECGVWRGGSSMMIAKILNEKKIRDKKLVMFDTFEGMSEPTQFDVDHNGEKADYLLANSSKEDQNSIWCYSDFNEVNNNILKTGFPSDQLNMIKGMVEETIPKHMKTEKISLLRLDTDFYESTKHELTHLFPLLSDNGVLIIDDYGHWEGCRKAVDEYFETNQVNILLNRIDNTGRIAIKTKN